MISQPFKSIGIGATFSPNLKANLYEASRLSLFFNCRLVLIHVGDKTTEKVEGFNEILQPFHEKGLNYELVFQPGDPVEVILSVCDSKQIELLILGALKKESFYKYYVGSIARRITRKAKCSVLLLINPSVERIQCKHIVVSGLDDAKTTKAIETSFYIGQQLNAEQLTIVEEITEQEIAIKVDDDKSLRMANLAKERIRIRETSRVKKIIDKIDGEIRSNIRVNSQPIFGPRGYSIGHYAQVARADLLVLPAQSKLSFWDRLFPHDVEHILTELPTDVLILQ
ncbi:MAG: universal stress protein [Bacteroidia bacterium]|nr:universal stress protein [Bacteroidia bacterium]MBT8270143.1 universal stress protein [Bacteroidia bacterium]NNF82203.1 universal stress protein [Flavobacteriaceae bacterium]NNK70950.1 universal stress protein [Flavobacteriaceae bacterium]NNL80571.1 universal stress protein [Flavobacteriaceae bacterium]